MNQVVDSLRRKLEVLASQEVSSRSLGAIRILVALNLLIEYGTHLALGEVDASSEVLALVAVMCLSSIVVMLGYKTRWSTIVLALSFGILHLDMFGGGWLAKVPDMPVLTFHCILVLTIAPSGRSLSIDRMLDRRRAQAQKRDPLAETTPYWALDLIALLLASTYFWAAFNMSDAAWLNGERVEMYYIQWYGASESLLHRPWMYGVSVLMAWGATIAQFVLALGLIVRRTRPWVFLGAYVLHIGFSMTLGITHLSFLMMAMLLACAPPQRVHELFTPLLAKRDDARDASHAGQAGHASHASLPEDSQPKASARWTTRLIGWIPVLLAFPILIWHASYLMPYMPDDSLISARYAERLIEGHGLTWTDGERVEGYSNLLWTVAVAAIGALGIDILDAMRLLGVLCMTATFLAISRAYAPRTFTEVIPPTVAALVLASAGPIGAWAIGGLEQSMVAVLLAWALVAVFPILDGEDESTRCALLVGIPLGLLCWTRPDGPLFTAVFAGVIVLLFKLRRTGWRLGLSVTALPVLAVFMQLGFRLLYYRDWLPNPAYIKARVAEDRLSMGIDYILAPWEWMLPALLLAGLGLTASFVGKHQRGRSILLLCCFFAWAGYVASVGGDIFAARRHWVPLWVLLAFMVAPGLDWVIRRKQVGLTLGVAFASLVMVGSLAMMQRHDPRIVKAKRQDYQWEGEILARVLGEGFRDEQPLTAVTAAGCIPYFSKLPSLDMLGLNDRHIARQRPDQVGSLAHDHADGAYVLDREPDLIVFNLGSPPAFAAGKQIRRDKRFTLDYTAVVFKGYVPHERIGSVYVRNRGRVGMQVEDDLVTVPGYLLGGRDMFAQPGVDGGIEAVVPANAKLTSGALPLRPGTWRVTVDPPNPDVEIGLYAEGANQRPTQVLSVTGKEKQVRLRVSSHTVSSLLGTLRVERVPNDSPEPTVAPVPTYVLEPFGTFEDGYGTWTSEGLAFLIGPAKKARKGQGPVRGNVGKFASSFVGDGVKGHLRSPPFEVSAGTVLSFRLAGGTHWRIGVRLMEGERTLMVWHGKSSATLAELRFALSPYAGRTLHLEIFDESSGGWGHVLADEFVLLHESGR